MLHGCVTFTHKQLLQPWEAKRDDLRFRPKVLCMNWSF